jgi:hypothetical protein
MFTHFLFRIIVYYQQLHWKYFCNSAKRWLQKLSEGDKMVSKHVAVWYFVR